MDDLKEYLINYIQDEDEKEAVRIMFFLFHNLLSDNTKEDVIDAVYHFLKERNKC